MEWRDEGIVIGVRRHGEGSVLLEAMTRAHGRHLGMVRGGRAPRMQALLQAGNAVDLAWRARLDEHLGLYQVEPLHLRAASLMVSPAALYGLGVLGTLVRLLPERDPHPTLFETLNVVVEALRDPALAAPLVIRFELALLGELGFGLDLSACAATGATQELVFVSPKSGRAVSAKAGRPYVDRMLRLPAFLRDGGTDTLPDPQAVADGFALTGFFLARNVYEPRGIPTPAVRAAFIAAVTL